MTGRKLSAQFSGQRYISLETYRRSGEAVRTTAFVVVDGGMLYVRTDPRTGKVKRVLDNPRVRVAASDARGSPKGEWVNGEAHMLEGEERTRILLLFKKKYGILAKILDPLNRIRGMGVTAVISIKV